MHQDVKGTAAQAEARGNLLAVQQDRERSFITAEGVVPCV